MFFGIFQFTRTGMTLVSEFSLGELKYLTEMCYVNGNLVVSGVTLDTIRVYHEETGNLLNEWKSCQVFPRLMGFEVEGKEYLLEGCTGCGAIHAYQFPETSSNYKTFCEHISPSAMCKGPTGTILVRECQKSIKQLRFSAGKFHLVHECSFELENVRNMCYCEKYGIVVMMQSDRSTLTGVMLSTGHIVWKHTEYKFGSPPRILEYSKEVFTMVDGRISLFNLHKLFVLEPKDGAIKYEIHDSTGSGWIGNITTRNNGHQLRFAIRITSGKQTRVSVYYLLPERCLPLKSITSNETNSKTDA